jgi:hypothetical protein
MQPQVVYNHDKSTVIQNISEYVQLESLSRERERVRERSKYEVVKVSQV